MHFASVLDGWYRVVEQMGFGAAPPNRCFGPCTTSNQDPLKWNICADPQQTRKVEAQRKKEAERERIEARESKREP